MTKLTVLNVNLNKTMNPPEGAPLQQVVDIVMKSCARHAAMITGNTTLEIYAEPYFSEELDDEATVCGFLYEDGSEHPCFAVYPMNAVTWAGAASQAVDRVEMVDGSVVDV